MEKFKRGSHFLYRTLLALSLLALTIGSPGAPQVANADSSSTAGPASAASPTVIAGPIASAGAARAPGSQGAAGAAAPASGTSQPAISLTFADIRGLVESAARGEEVWGEVKYVLPLLTTVIAGVITLIAGVGTYYIRAESRNLRRAIENKLNAQIKSQNEQFDKSFKEIEAKMDFQGAGIRYRLAVIAWKSKDFRDAIYQGTLALENADHALELFESLNERGNGEAKDLTDDREYRCHILGDLAYYYAEEYRKTHQISDGAEAMKHARQLLSAWRGLAPQPPTSLVDSYLYVLATVQAIPQEDQDAGRALWKSQQERLTDYLEKDDPDMVEHIALFERFFGPV